MKSMYSMNACTDVVAFVYRTYLFYLNNEPFSQCFTDLPLLGWRQY